MKRILARTLVSFALLGLSLSIPAFSADTAALFMTHPTDVNGAVREVLSLFDPLLLQKNIRVVLEVGSSKIPGAPGKFMEMTLNMLSNLLVHSPSGSCLRVSRATKRNTPTKRSIIIVTNRLGTLRKVVSVMGGRPFRWLQPERVLHRRSPAPRAPASRPGAGLLP